MDVVFVVCSFTEPKRDSSLEEKLQTSLLVRHTAGVAKKKAIATSSTAPGLSERSVRKRRPPHRFGFHRVASSPPGGRARPSPLGDTGRLVFRGEGRGRGADGGSLSPKCWRQHRQEVHQLSLDHQIAASSRSKPWAGMQGGWAGTRRDRRCYTLHTTGLIY